MCVFNISELYSRINESMKMIYAFILIHIDKLSRKRKLTIEIVQGFENKHTKFISSVHKPALWHV